MYKPEDNMMMYVGGTHILRLVIGTYICSALYHRLIISSHVPTPKLKQSLSTVSLLP